MPRWGQGLGRPDAEPSVLHTHGISSLKAEPFNIHPLRRGWVFAHTICGDSSFRWPFTSIDRRLGWVHSHFRACVFFFQQSRPISPPHVAHTLVGYPFL